MPLHGCLELMGEAIRKHDDWLKALPPDYGGPVTQAVPTIVVTETPLERRYYAWSDEQLSIISLEPIAKPSVRRS